MKIEGLSKEAKEARFSRLASISDVIRADVIIVAKPLEQCGRVLETLSEQNLSRNLVIFVGEGMPALALSPQPEAQCLVTTTRPFKCYMDENKVVVEEKEPIVWVTCLRVDEGKASAIAFGIVEEIFHHSGKIGSCAVWENRRAVEREA